MNNVTVGIPRSLLFYYYKDLWLSFFEKLEIKTILSDISNKEILKNGESLAVDESCLSLKLYLGHVNNLIGKCDYILVPRLFSVKKYEGVCTNFNCLYDLINNLFSINILNYNVDVKSHNYQVTAFIKMGAVLGFSYIESYKAYKYAITKSKIIRDKKELVQHKLLTTSKKKKILLAGHPYNLYDDLIGKEIIKYLKTNNIDIIYSDRINKNIIDKECYFLSTDIHWTHSKEVVASINYYKNKVDGIILISSFPCGPDSLSNELCLRKVKDIPILSLVFDMIDNETSIITRLESFLDIIKFKEDSYAKNS